MPAVTADTLTLPRLPEPVSGAVDQHVRVHPVGQAEDDLAGVGLEIERIGKDVLSAAVVGEVEADPERSAAAGRDLVTLDHPVVERDARVGETRSPHPLAGDVLLDVDAELLLQSGQGLWDTDHVVVERRLGAAVREPVAALDGHVALGQLLDELGGGFDRFGCGRWFDKAAHICFRR